MVRALAAAIGACLLAAAPAPGLDRLPTDAKVIALTFDAHVEEGVARTGAEEILAVLRARGVRCTFFLSGRTVLARPELVQRIAADGHEIGNHSYSHAWVAPADEREERLVGELARTQELLGAAAVPLWRAPYGNVNAEQEAWARGLGLTHVGWTLDLLDWEADPRSPRYLSVERLLQRFVTLLGTDAAAGAIVLCHLATARTDDHLHTVLARMIDAALERGYRFVRVSDPGL